MSDSTQNLLLNVLSPESRNLILSQAQHMALAVRASLQSTEETPRYVYFPTSGITSVVVELADGSTAETALIGCEGMTGGYSLLGPSAPPTAAFMQVAGSGFRVPFSVMRDLFAQNAEIRSRILECIQQQGMTTNQIAACNSSHEAEPRLARWLLMVLDRTQQSSFQLTQEFMAEMLGARRTTVALAAGSLQRSGFIKYSRGKITIRSREHLETAACDCYQVTRRLFQGLYK